MCVYIYAYTHTHYLYLRYRVSICACCSWTTCDRRRKGRYINSIFTCKICIQLTTCMRTGSRMNRGVQTRKLAVPESSNEEPDCFPRSALNTDVHIYVRVCMHTYVHTYIRAYHRLYVKIEQERQSYHPAHALKYIRTIQWRLTRRQSLVTCRQWRLSRRHSRVICSLWRLGGRQSLVIYRQWRYTSSCI